MGYVISGVSHPLFPLYPGGPGADSYQYLTGTSPEREDFPAQGRYEDFVSYLRSFLVEEDREKFAGMLDRNAVAGTAGQHGLPVRVPGPERDGIAWEHLNIICWSVGRAGPARSCSSGRISPG